MNSQEDELTLPLDGPSVGRAWIGILGIVGGVLSAVGPGILYVKDFLQQFGGGVDAMENLKPTWQPWLTWGWCAAAGLLIGGLLALAWTPKRTARNLSQPRLSRAFGLAGLVAACTLPPTSTYSAIALGSWLCGQNSPQRALQVS